MGDGYRPAVIRLVGVLAIAAALGQLGDVGELGEPAHQGPVEEAVLDLIEDKHGPALELDLIA